MIQYTRYRRPPHCLRWGIWAQVKTRFFFKHGVFPAYFSLSFQALRAFHDLAYFTLQVKLLLVKSLKLTVVWSDYHPRYIVARKLVNKIRDKGCRKGLPQKERRRAWLSIAWSRQLTMIKNSMDIVTPWKVWIIISLKLV